MGDGVANTCANGVLVVLFSTFLCVLGVCTLERRHFVVFCFIGGDRFYAIFCALLVWASTGWCFLVGSFVAVGLIRSNGLWEKVSQKVSGGVCVHVFLVWYSVCDDCFEVIVLWVG